MNITSFMENEVSEFFHLTFFFGKSNNFGENGEKIFWGDDHFLVEGVILC